MKIVMRIKISGGRGDGTEWPDPGIPFYVDDDEGAQLCAGGLAVPVAEEPYTETRYDSGGFLPPGTSMARNDTDVPEPVKSAVPKPIVNSPKSAWVDYAVAQGTAADVAAAMTKADLIAKFGGQGSAGA